MRPKRFQALTILAVFVASLVAPVVVQAQEYEVDLSDDSANFVSDVTGRLATKESLETQWSRAEQRRQEVQAEIAALEREQSKGGREDTWYQSAAERLRALKDKLTENDSVLSRTRTQLGTLYGKIDRDRQQVSQHKDPAVRQELGTLVGVAGVAAVPIWSRPTVGSLAGSAGQAINMGRLATVNARIPRYQSWATSAGNRAVANEAALAGIKPTRYVPQSSGGGAGELVLKPHHVNADGSTGAFAPGKPVKTGIPAKFQAADGSWHANERGMVHANDLASLQNSRVGIQNNINKLRLEASRATNAKVKSVLESRATALEGKKVQLETNIREYNANNPSLGSQVKQVGVNAAKWAAFSAGISVATNTITQLTQNGWDPSKLDWGAATAQLRDPHFWGGTAGSFVGSYGATLIASALPGGAFVKTLFAVGGAAVGWQAGSGQLGNTDWVALGAGTVGSTVGILIGTALGGPIGAFIGGIVGQLAADFILKKVREWIIKEVPADASGGAGDRTAYGSSEPPSGDWGSGAGSNGGQGGYNGTNPADTGYSSGGQGSGGSAGGDAQAIAEQRAQVYQEMIALQSEMKSNPQAFQEFVQKQREYDALTRQLHSMQRDADIRSNAR